MKPRLEDLLEGLSAVPSKDDDRLKAGVEAAKPKTPETALDRTTVNAKRVLDEEAEARADKTARLKALRERREAGETE